MNLRRQQSELRRQRILAEASEIFSARGFKSARIEDVACQSGVSKGLVYVFFRSKQELYEAVLKQELLVWLEKSAQLASEPDDPLQGMEKLFTGVFDILRSSPVLQTMLGGEERVELKRYWPVLKRIDQRWRKRICLLIEHGMQQGAFRSDLDVPRTADVIHSLQRSYLDRAFRTRDGKHAPDEKLIAVVSDFVLQGIRL